MVIQHVMAADFAQLLIDALKSPDAGAFSTHYTQYSKIGSSIYIFDRRHSVTGSGMDTFDPIVFVTDTDQEHHFRIQTGADSGQEMGMQLPWVTTDKLRIRGISVLSHDAASAGLSMVDRATDYLNGERSRMGAYENRLKHAGKKLDVQRENLTNSESRIRDAQMSDEIVEMSRGSIIQQSIQSVLAQANQQNELVLQLLS